MILPPTLHIHLLGDFRLVADDTAISMSHVPRAQSLLVYLLLHHGASQIRSHLAYMLWPDSTEAQAHSNLRKVLHQLRQALPHADQVLAIDRQTLAWQSGSPIRWTLDVMEFEQALASAEQVERAQKMAELRQALERAVLLYRGNLFPGCYEEWIFPERDRLHQLFLQAATRLIDLLEQAHDYKAALQVAQQLLRHEPLHEETYRQVMRLYALCGDRAAALRTYYTCAKLLDRELGTEPGTLTQAIYESLRHAEATSQPVTKVHAAGRTTTQLIGRQTEWIALQAAWLKAIEGQPHLLILSGDAGIGKTRLAEEMEAWVSRQGLATASARCYATLEQLAYTPVTVWLRTIALSAGLLSLTPVWLTEIARLLPELLDTRPDLPHPTALTEEWQRQRFFEALTRLMLSTRQPLLLLLDDLQWCDHETLEWLQYLWHCALQVHACLLLVATVRSEDLLAGHALMKWSGAFQRDGLLTELPLAPLGLLETTALAEQLLDHQLATDMTHSLYRETEGNPLFIVEMVRASMLATEQQTLTHPDVQRALLAPFNTSLPPTLHAILAMRLEQLTPLARKLVNVAAVIGRTFSFAILASVSEEPEELLIQGLDELWQRRIVYEQGDDAYNFSHDKLREEAQSTLGAARRRFLHRRVAEALQELEAANLDAISSQLATHYEQAGLLEQAILSYQRAGEAAYRVYDHTEALCAWQRAITLFSSSQHVQRTLAWYIMSSIAEHLGDVLEVTGKHQEAADAYQRSLSLVPEQASLWQARLYRKIAATRDYPPHLAEALQAYQKAEQILEKALDIDKQAWSEEWIHILLGQLFIFFMQAQVQEMTRIIERVQPLLEKAGTTAQHIALYGYLTMRDAVHNRYVLAEDTVSLCRQGLNASLDTGNPHLIGTAHFNMGYSLFLYNDFAQAEIHLQTALAAAEQVGDSELAARCRWHFLPLVWRRCGKVEALRDLLTRTQSQGERRFAGVIVAHRAWLAWRDDNLAEARTHGQAAQLTWQRQRQVYTFQWTALWPLIAVALTQERLADAMDTVHALLVPTQQLLPEALTILLEEAIHTWNDGQHASVPALLQQAVSRAQDMCYL